MGERVRRRLRLTSFRRPGTGSGAPASPGRRRSPTDPDISAVGLTRWLPPPGGLPGRDGSPELLVEGRPGDIRLMEQSWRAPPRRRSPPTPETSTSGWGTPAPARAGLRRPRRLPTRSRLPGTSQPPPASDRCRVACGRRFGAPLPARGALTEMGSSGLTRDGIGDPTTVDAGSDRCSHEGRGHRGDVAGGFPGRTTAGSRPPAILRAPASPPSALR